LHICWRGSRRNIFHKRDSKGDGRGSDWQYFYLLLLIPRKIVSVICQIKYCRLKAGMPVPKKVQRRDRMNKLNTVIIGIFCIAIIACGNKNLKVNMFQSQQIQKLKSWLQVFLENKNFFSSGWQGCSIFRKSQTRYI
jgi:hypothetical protein